MNLLCTFTLNPLVILHSEWLFYPLAIWKILLRWLMQNFQILAFHTTSKDHIPLILPLISFKKSLTNTNFPKFWFPLENLNCIPGNGDRLTLFNFKKMHFMKYSSLNNYSCPSVVLSSKNDDPPAGWVPTHKYTCSSQSLYDGAQRQRSKETAFLTQNTKETFAGGLRCHQN